MFKISEHIRYQITRGENINSDNWKQIAKKIRDFANEVECDDSNFLVFEGLRGGGKSCQEVMEDLLKETNYKECSFKAFYIEHSPEDSWEYADT